MGKFSFLSRRSNMLWLVVIGLAALAQGASVDVEEIQVNATDESEFESLLAANDQLFDFQLLKPLKRSLFEITMEDIMDKLQRGGWMVRQLLSSNNHHSILHNRASVRSDLCDWKPHS